MRESEPASKSRLNVVQEASEPLPEDKFMSDLERAGAQILAEAQRALSLRFTEEMNRAKTEARKAIKVYKDGLEGVNALPKNVKNKRTADLARAMVLGDLQSQKATIIRQLKQLF